MKLAVLSLASVTLLGIGACAKGGNGGAIDDGRVDAGEVPQDATRPPPVDATPPIDGIAADAMLPIDAPMTDAAVMMPDAMCVPVTTELLANAAFDLAPIGTGWVQTPADPSYPIVTTSGVTPDTAPNKAWLGGLTSADDIIYQDVVIPANTTQIVFTGKYIVGTQETSTTAYDFGAIGMLDGMTVLYAKQLSNLTPTGAAWVAVTTTLTQNLSGKTIRMQMDSSNDFLYPTNFFFDSLSLKATHCP